jgi:capsular exopolysaccharide synthesis family protein
MDNPRQLNGHDSHENHELVMRPRHGQTLNVRAYPEPTAAPVAETDDFSALMQYLWILRKHKWALGLALLLGALASLGVSVWMTPMYRAKTSLEIQNVQEPFSAPIVTADPALVTQTQLLLSDTMRKRAASKLSSKSDASSLEARGPVAFLRNFLWLSDPAKTIRWEEAVDNASVTLTVTPVKDSRVLVIESDSPNPAAAAGFINTLAQEYVQSNQEQRLESYQNTSTFLTQAQQELKTKVEQSEQRLAEFAKAKGLVFTSGTDNITEDKLKQLQAQLLNASSERIAKQAVYESSLSSPTESLPSVLDSGPMAQYQAKIADLRRELAELSATLTPAHYRTQRVQAQINELESAREKERTNIISRIRIEYEASLKRENQLRRDFDAQSRVLTNQADDLIEYNIRLREVETNKKLYETALQQGKESSLASAMRTSNARVVDPAIVPLFPRTPNLPLNLALGMLSGLFCGAVFVIARSRSDASIQVPGPLEVHLNLRELGIIPVATTDPGIRALPASPRATGPGKNGRGGATTAQSEKSSKDCLELVTWCRKTSVISEAFRSTMTSILFSGENGDRPKVLVITSPSPQEGKSTVVSNLAIALAEINHRVLLIDADMRLPRLHSIFDLPNTFGLSDVLHDRMPIHEYAEESLVRKTHIPDLYVLPAGPARTNLSRLLYSTKMKELITRFRDSFDTILIDSAPVLSVPDSRFLARAADAVVLVVRAHRTHQEAAYAAVRCFEEDGRQILGTILNDWDPKVSAYGHYGHYGHYNSYSSYHPL